MKPALKYTNSLISNRVFILILSFLHISNAFAQVELWGITTKGGMYDQGCLFKTDSNGENQSVVFSFGAGKDSIISTLGFVNSTPLCQAANGKFYGIGSRILRTPEDQYYQNYHYYQSVLYELDPEVPELKVKKIIQEVYDFEPPVSYKTFLKRVDNYLVALIKTKNPEGIGLLRYEITIDSMIINSLSDINASINYSLVFINGKIYGTSVYGGLYNAGSIVEIDPETFTWKTKFSFDNSISGLNPRSGLTLAEDGKLYGITPYGGNAGNGTIYRYVTDSNEFQVLYNFSINEREGLPMADMVENETGIFLGLTFKKDGSEWAIYEFKVTDNEFSTKKRFNINNNKPYPIDGPIADGNGNVYLISSGGGTKDAGIMMEYNADQNTVNTVIDFNGQENGETPVGGITVAANGKIYGLTLNGGNYNDGLFFEYDPGSQAISRKILITEYFNTSFTPTGNIILAWNRSIYGSGVYYNQAESNYHSVLYKYNPVNNEINAENDIGYGSATKECQTLLTPADNDKIYISNISNTRYYDYESLYQPYGEFYEFDPIINRVKNRGYAIETAACQLGNRLYWLSYNGITFYDPEIGNSFLPYTLQFKDIRCHYPAPLASLIGGPEGTLYGSTGGGGKNNYGYFFNIRPGVQYAPETKMDYDSINTGKINSGMLLLASDGKIYGMNRYGGQFGYGTLFDFDIKSEIWRKLIDFDSINTGSHPTGGLMESLNGKLYGMTYDGGAYGYGVLFEFDPQTINITKKLDFNGTNGKYPSITQLVMVDENKLIMGLPEQNNDQNIVRMFPNPVDDQLEIQFKTGTQSCTLSIYNLQGKIIYTSTVLTTQQLTVNTRDFKTGIYIVRLNGRKFNFTGRFIKR